MDEWVSGPAAGGAAAADDTTTGPRKYINECASCAAGTFAASEESETCSQCEAGKITATKAQSECAECAEGKFADEDGLSECADCAAGTFAPETALTACYKCNMGKVQADEGKTECVDCEAGSFSDHQGGKKCELCANGKIAVAAGAAACTDCEAGTIAATTGLSECAACEAGTFAEAAGESECMDCAAGTFAEATGFSECPDCAAGKFQGAKGQSECVDCEAGLFMGETGATECTKCAAGTFQAEAGKTECPACADGEWAGGAGASKCVTWTACAVGSYSLVDPTTSADRSCVPCEPQTFTDEPNLLKCKPWTVCRGGAAPEEEVSAEEEESSMDDSRRRLGEEEYEEAEGETEDVEEGGDSPVVDIQEGVVVPGTASSDVECEACTEGFVSLVADSFSECFELADHDEDGYPDRFDYMDDREEDDNVPDENYDPDKDMDTRDVPATGGPAYDTCPFDRDDDSDGDGICSGEVPEVYRKLLENSKYYSSGGSQVDLCPNDPKNDEDKDGKCDDLDKDITTWDFFSNNLVGWQDKECEERRGCPQPAADFIKPTPITKTISPVDLKTIAFDPVVMKVCAANEDQATVLAEPAEGRNCEDVCEKHHMICVGARAWSPEEAAEGEEAAARRLTAAGELTCDSSHGEKTSCQDAVGVQYKCVCEPNPEPYKVQGWTQHKLCPTCHASTEHDPKATGAMTTEFKIKKNALSFFLKGAPGATRYVQLTIKNTKAANMKKALKDQPFIVEPLSAYDGAWYPVEWDLSKYVGETAVLEVADFDPNESISVDHFNMFNDKHGCLPACMKIEDAVCEGETCFYFEDDKVAYRVLQKTGPQSGVYCRAVPSGNQGAPLGPAIGQMGSTGKHGRVTASLEYLAAGALPRCLHLDLRGSHIAIKAADRTIGDDEPVLEFAYADASERMGLEKAMCVYPTLKPRCVAYSKPSVAFTLKKKAVCLTQKYEATCFDQCYSIHCAPDELKRKGACGRGKAFQDCANCCGGNNNVASGCFRRRRRLGASVSSEFGNGELNYTQNECAENCLNTFGCIAFLHGEDDSCSISTECDATKKGRFGYEQGGWHVWRTLKAADLTSEILEEKEVATPGGDEKPAKKKKRRKKGKGGKDEPIQFGPPPGVEEEPFEVAEIDVPMANPDAAAESH